jgi:NAD(P)-dependent dehydrogenase (short-subunit alcohol dehydrogenase family)
MPTVLITGANRGLGLEFSRRFAGAGWQVLATCRTPERADTLQALAERHAGFSVRRLDVADFASMDVLTGQLAGQPLDVLLNNAGVYGDGENRAFGALDYSAWERTMRVNTLAPVRLAECLLPNLQKGERRLIVSLTSLMGSIADNRGGGALLYRSSKAALNAAMKSLSIDLRFQRIGVLLLHPGWVRTDMGGKDAPLSAEQSVAGMVQVIENFPMEQSGAFLDYRGTSLPW